MSAIDSRSHTVQVLALAVAATVVPIILQRRSPNMGELVKLAGLGLGLWGRLRPGAGQPLTVG